RTLGDVIVARDGDHAAVLRGAGHVGVLEDVGAAVDARALAVPDAEHAVELLRLRIEVELLRAPDRSGAELLLHAGLEDDVRPRWGVVGAPARVAVVAGGGPAGAADEAGRVEPRERVALALQHGQAPQRLHAAHEGTAVLEAVLVVERDGLERLADRLGKGGV